MAPGLVDQLVVNVGDVDDPGDFVSTVDEVALDRVEDNRTDGVPDVTGLVDGWTAKINPHLARCDRFERFLFAGQCVVDGQTHR